MRMRKYQLPHWVICIVNLLKPGANLTSHTTVCMCMLYCQMAGAQETKPSIDSIIDIPATYFTKIENKYNGLEDRVTRQTTKYLQKLFNREKKAEIHKNHFKYS